MRTLIVLVCLLCAVMLWAQDSAVVVAAAAQAPVDPQFGGRRNHQTPDEARIEREMAKDRNKDRQKKLKEDTDKLVQLATELKQYVDKTNEHILSVEVLKKSDEIERLAKSVHDKMKQGSYGLE
ncbi:MAG: hypothetical protein ACXVZV_09920 [Terriglobales bacterium]